jgi:hypothetical protein
MTRLDLRRPRRAAMVIGLAIATAAVVWITLKSYATDTATPYYKMTTFDARHGILNYLSYSLPYQVGIANDGRVIYVGSSDVGSSAGPVVYPIGIRQDGRVIYASGKRS